MHSYLISPEFSPRQLKRLQSLYFSATTTAGQVKFATACLQLGRKGYPLGDFFEQEGLGDVYQEMLDESMAAHLKRRAGHIYLAVHPIYIQGLYKIGATRKTPEERRRSLTTAGIPGQFTMVKSWPVPDAFAAEAHCARTLSQRRIQREFYEGTFPELTTAIDEVVEREWRLAQMLSPAIKSPLNSKLRTDLQ